MPILLVYPKNFLFLNENQQTYMLILKGELNSEFQPQGTPKPRLWQVNSLF